MAQLELVQVESGLWEAYQSRGSIAAQSHPVFDRWLRSRDLGVDPEGTPESREILRGPELREHQERSAPLLAAADRVLTTGGEEVFTRAHYRLLVTDEQGLILRSQAGGEFRDTARHLRLIEGGRWAEEIQGTNAIGTALAEERAVTVAGCAHFVRSNHDLVCYASPIRDPYGRLVGVIDATSHALAAHPAIQLAVAHGARAIQEALRGQAWLGAGRNEVGDRLRQAVRPTFLVEWPGVVRAGNAAVEEAGGLSLTGTRLDTLCGLHWQELLEALEAGTDRLRAPFWSTTGRPTWLRLEPVASEPERGEPRLILAVLVTVEDGSTERVQTGAHQVPSSEAPRRDDPFANLVGSDPVMARTKELAARIARSPLPILLLAETGTGKGLLARAIHRASPRADGPFVDINCGALSPQLLESELFGYAPGAFTGAHRTGREGKIHQATGGTLFLDEVAETSPSLQAMLLKVLEEGYYYRVGENEPRRSDFRLIAATCRDLDAMVAAGTFRRDLYYRLGGARLTLPSLQNRSDLQELAEALLNRLAGQEGRHARPHLAPEALTALQAHSWPGNVRELRMALQFGLAVAPGRVIRAQDLPPQIHATDPEQGPEAPITDLRSSEREALLRTLRATNGNVSAAARRLGVARSTVYRMIERHGIEMRRTPSPR
ncbi:MAG: sigma-54-dependent Fis family transcriptional regulator [Acidobacteriota bacterium]|nr:sigma-54-dependent Fis family transcriptional regulator [Acidobacteriota bacterium]